MRLTSPLALLVTLSFLSTASAASAATWWRDFDGDTYGDPANFTESPTQPPGYVANNLDCNDTNPAIRPGAPEVCNGVDDDCDGQIDEGVGTIWFRDADADSYGNPNVTTTACARPAGYVASAGDCNDANPSIHPGAIEVCNGIDDDCDGQIDEGAADAPRWYADADADSYGDPANSVVACAAPAGHVADGSDCDDTNAGVFPGATEVCNGIDDDCDGQIDEGAAGGSQWFADADADTYGNPANSVVACAAPAGYVANGGDCDDTNAGVFPGATEACNGRDDDCDGLIDEGCTAYEVTSALDVPNDQGRRVRVRWTRSNQDVAGAATPVFNYSIYRRIEAGLAPQGLNESSAPSAVMAAPPGDWDFVLNVPATGEASYSTLAGTLCDSTSAGICWARFFVRAHTGQPTVFFDTPVDSGYSVDNLAPNVPQNLTAVGSPTGTQLDWADNLEEDFGHFRVYRSTDPAFVPVPGTMAHATTASNWTDSTTPAGAYHYKVTAVDLNGNESAPATFGAVVGTDDTALPERLALHPAVPNPSRGSVALAIDLPRAGHVRLAVYDARGSLVRGLIDGAREAGRFAATWSGRGDDGLSLPAGVYYVRLKALGSTEVRKVLLVR